MAVDQLTKQVAKVIGISPFHIKKIMNRWIQDGLIDPILAGDKIKIIEALRYEWDERPDQCDRLIDDLSIDKKPLNMAIDGIKPMLWAIDKIGDLEEAKAIFNHCYDMLTMKMSKNVQNCKEPGYG